MPKDTSVEPSEEGGSRPLTASCSSCRSRKIRCSGEYPCDNCTKNGRTCEYRAKLKPGLKTGAGQVERRLGEVEQMLANHSAELSRLNYQLSLVGPAGSSGSQSHPTPGGSAPSTFLYDHPQTPSQPYLPSTPSQQFNRASPYNSGTMDPPASHSLAGPSSSHQPNYLQANPLLQLANQIPLDSYSNNHPLETSPAANLYDLRGTSGSTHAFGEGMDGIQEDSKQAVSMAAPTSTARRRLSNQQNPAPASSSQQKEHLWGISSATPAVSSSKHADTTDIPPPEVVTELISLFFRHVHPNIPLLLHSDFTVPNTPPASSPFTPSSIASAGPPTDSQPTRPSILVFGIICISLRFSKNAHFASHGPTSKKHYHQVARQKVIMSAMDKMNVQSLQALAILALDSMESGEGPSGWGGVLSLLTGGIRHGNLGEEEPIVKAISDTKISSTKQPSPNGKVYNPTNKTALFPSTENWMEVEERRRLFWLVYVLDRYASVSTGWAFEYGDEEVVRRLPCRDDNWMAGAGQQLTPLVTAQLPSPLSSPSISLFAYLSSLIHHLGQVHAFIRKPLDLSSTKDTQAWYSEFRVHDERLLGWWMCLPEKVKRLERGDWREGDGEGGLKALINTAFFATMIRLQSAAAYPPVSSPSFLPSESAGISCLSAARSMSRVAILVGRHASPSGSSNGPIDARDLSPLFGWTCWVGARALVAHAYIKSSPLLPETAILVETLNALSPYWATSKRYAKILSAAVQESHALHPTTAFAALISSPASQHDAATAGSASGAGTISILADMRRTAWNAEAAIRDNEEEEEEEDGERSDESANGLRPSVSNVRGASGGGEGGLGEMMGGTGGGGGWDPSGLGQADGMGGLGRGMGPPSGGLGPGGGGAVDFSGDWVGDLFTWFEVPPMSLPPSPSGH